MFKPHIGRCINGHDGFIVVKKGLCNRCNYELKQEKKQDREIQREKPKATDKNIQALVDLYDTLFSILRRKMATDQDGNCTCCTCGKTFKWNRIQCGHFITRAVYYLRWNTINTAPQCDGPECNGHPDGNQKKFAIFLDKSYGMGTADELKRERHMPFKLDREWLMEEIAKCKKKLDVLKYIK